MAKSVTAFSASENMQWVGVVMGASLASLGRVGFPVWVLPLASLFCRLS